MATPPKKSLGRGLGSLIGAGINKPNAEAAPVAAPTPAPSAPGLTLSEILLTQIVPNPRQPRREFDEASVKELAESIRSEGLLQPVVVRKTKDGFELIAGERRFRAFKLLGQKTITARLLEASDASSAVLALVENLQRSDLNPIDEALGIASLMRDFSLTQESVADRLGKPRATVANSVRLLSLDREIQGYLSKGQISAGHAKVLLAIENLAHRIQATRKVVEDGLSVRATESLVKTFVTDKKKVHRDKEKTVVEDVQKKIASHLSAKVQVTRTGKKGTIIISYEGDDDLARLLEKFGIRL
jgi:ParB family transcriptional regulator, chromosome partitioning protein